MNLELTQEEAMFLEAVLETTAQRGLRADEDLRSPLLQKLYDLAPDDTIQVTWDCQGCGNENPIKFCTDVKRVICHSCGKIHLVTGLHVNGTPIVHLIAGQS